MHDTPTKHPSDDSAPPCSHCRQPMRLMRTVPRLGGLPELHTFACRPCGVCLTAAVERRDEGPARYDFALQSRSIRTC
jgi:cytidine deaminase